MQQASRASDCYVEEIAVASKKRQGASRDLDFAVVIGDRRLNIEVDGERYHRTWSGELCLRDQLRNQRLIELGWEVKRFWVYEIRDRLPDVVSHVKSWVSDADGTRTS